MPQRRSPPAAGLSLTLASFTDKARILALERELALSLCQEIFFPPSSLSHHPSLFLDINKPIDATCHYARTIWKDCFAAKR